MSENTLPIEQLPEEYESWYQERDRSALTVLSCGDDRLVAQGGEAGVIERDEKGDTYYLRHFGGGPSLATVALKALYADSRSELTNIIDPPRLYSMLRQEMPRLSRIAPIAHSDTAHEPEGAFRRWGQAPIGCARLKGNSTVLHQAAYHPAVIEQGALEYNALFGNIDRFMPYERIVAGLRDAVAGDSEARLDTLQLDRDFLLRTNTPVAVLDGAHLPAANTFVSFNFTFDRMSRPGEFYGVDAAQTAEAIMCALPELNLNPDALLASIVHTACSTRGALIHHESGQYDPAKLKAVIYGDPAEAVHRLRDLREQIQRTL